VISCECSESDDDVSKMVWRRKAVWKSGAGTWCHCNITEGRLGARKESANCCIFLLGTTRHPLHNYRHTHLFYYARRAYTPSSWQVPNLRR
jgi:hypothetical protein